MIRARDSSSTLAKMVNTRSGPVVAPSWCRLVDSDVMPEVVRSWPALSIAPGGFRFVTPESRDRDGATFKLESGKGWSYRWLELNPDQGDTVDAWSHDPDRCPGPSCDGGGVLEHPDRRGVQTGLASRLGRLAVLRQSSLMSPLSIGE